MKILEELYHGNINPNVKFYKQNTNYAKAMDIIATNEDILSELLKGTEKKVFMEYLDAQAIVMSESSVEEFIIGFKLGAKIALAMVSEDDRIFKDIV
ncbi:MAG: hypothetical protein R3Y35_14685 [Clostridia bacterium]